MLMPRGLGRIERDVLALLEGPRQEAAGAGEWSALELAAKVYAVRPDAEENFSVNAAQYTAVRRALGNLQRRGGHLANAFGYRPSVLRLERDGLEDEQIERALRKVELVHDASP